MAKRPISVTIVSLVLIAAGVAGIAYHSTDLKAFQSVQFDMLGILLIRILAVIAGVFMLFGHNWARWLAIAWIGAHVGISFYHSLGQVAIHAIVLLIFAFILFRAPARDYFVGEHLSH